MTKGPPSPPPLSILGFRTMLFPRLVCRQYLFPFVSLHPILIFYGYGSWHASGPPLLLEAVGDLVSYPYLSWRPPDSLPIIRGHYLVVYQRLPSLPAVSLFSPRQFLAGGVPLPDLCTQSVKLVFFPLRLVFRQGLRGGPVLYISPPPISFTFQEENQGVIFSPDPTLFVVPFFLRLLTSTILLLRRSLPYPSPNDNGTSSAARSCFRRFFSISYSDSPSFILASAVMVLRSPAPPCSFLFGPLIFECGTALPCFLPARLCDLSL